MAEQVDTTFREVLYQMSQVNLVRLLPWVLFTVANPITGPVCSMSEALASDMQPIVDAPAGDTNPVFEGSLAPASTSSPAH